MTDLTLPAAMVEAAARTLYDTTEVATSILTWDGLPGGDTARERYRVKARTILTAALAGCEVRTEQQRLPMALQWAQEWHPTDEARFTRLVITTGWEQQ